MQLVTDIQDSIYEVDLPLTELELRAMCDGLAMAITGNKRVLDTLRQIENEPAQLGAIELQAQIHYLMSIKARCATLLTAYPDKREGWRLVASADSQRVA